MRQPSGLNELVHSFTAKEIVGAWVSATVVVVVVAVVVDVVAVELAVEVDVVDVPVVSEEEFSAEGGETVAVPLDCEAADTVPDDPEDPPDNS